MMAEVRKHAMEGPSRNKYLRLAAARLFGNLRRKGHWTVSTAGVHLVSKFARNPSCAKTDTSGQMELGRQHLLHHAETHHPDIMDYT